jgi:hypothetical protein
LRIALAPSRAGIAGVTLTLALAACAVDDPAPPAPPAPSSSPAGLEGATLRYCLAPELGEATPIVATLMAAVAAAGDGAIELVHVPAADAACRFDHPDVDLAVAAWGPDGGCTTTTDELACAVRTLLVDLEDLGAATADQADLDVAEDVRAQLDWMRDLGLGTAGAPPIAGGPPVEPAATGCSNLSIGPITPANPTSFQSISLSASYQVDVFNCSLPTFAWSSSVAGYLGGAPTVTTQLSPGVHVLTFSVTVTCIDPSDPTQTPAQYYCETEQPLEVAPGTLAPGDYCDRSAEWWMAAHYAGTAHIQDESATAVVTLSGTNLPDLLIGNGQANKINGRRSGDCLMGGGETDVIEGHAGLDTLLGGDGPDRLLGHDDRDVIRGGAHADRVRGGSGGDLIYGDDGDDHLDGNYDNDTLYGGADDDRLLGGWHDDLVYGGDGDDCARGDSGADRLFGDAGYDQLLGELGADDLDGGVDDDHLDGGWGDDLVRGGDGDDRLLGDAGADDLYGDDGDDRLCGGTGVDDKYGGPEVSADTCQFGGSNTGCELISAACPIAGVPPC